MILGALWTEDATHRDPVMEGEGHRGIDALIGGVQARFPGFRFALSGRAPDGYGDRVRFSWDLGPRAARPSCRARTSRSWPGTAGSGP